MSWAHRRTSASAHRPSAVSEYDASVYAQVSGGVQREVKELRTILGGLQAKGDERVWLRHQTDGDLDDSKLVEGLTGERTIYKRRGTHEPSPGGEQQHPKRVHFVADISGSMYRFNGHDQRLERMLQSVCMVMEAFEDAEPERIVCEITGHSGEAATIPFVEAGKPFPADDKARLQILQMMHAHTQFCLSGGAHPAPPLPLPRQVADALPDHTLEATRAAVQRLADVEEADERFVIVLSDANLERYGIHPSLLAAELVGDDSVKAFCIMLGSLGPQAERLKAHLPPGRGFVCFDTAELPKVLKQILTDVMEG